MGDRQTKREQLEHLEVSDETFTNGERAVGFSGKTRSPGR